MRSIVSRAVAELRVERTIEIDAPLERVFDLWVDPRRVPEWRHAIRAIDHSEPLDRPGARLGVHWSRRFERTEAVLSQFERPRIHEVAATARPPFTATATFAPIEGCSVTLVLALGVPLPLRPFLRMRLKAELAGELDRFKTLAESELSP
jgi:uncharacterized protein YndB with AHSA1/START domain